jgi:hypothetical protein
MFNAFYKTFMVRARVRSFVRSRFFFICRVSSRFSRVSSSLFFFFFFFFFFLSFLSFCVCPDDDDDDDDG